MIESLETRRLLSVVTVNTVGDTDMRDGGLSLREAIEYVNGTLAYSSLSASEQAQVDNTQPLGTNDTINFGFDDPGVHTISLDDNLPQIIKKVTIDGYSQAGASANTLATGDNANILVQIDASNVLNTSSGDPPFVNELFLAEGSDGSVIRGLSLTGFNSTGIYLYDQTGATIEGNFIGVLPNGQAAPIQKNSEGNPYNNTGINDNATGTTIGGTAAADRNIISGNGTGVTTDGDSITVEGNYIGTNLAGMAAIANSNAGLVMAFGVNDTIGGTTDAARNIISGNDGDGIALNGFDSESFTGSVIEGNYIGVGVDGSTAVANLGDGINLSASSHFYGNDSDLTVGGTAAGAGNVISGNELSGIVIANKHAIGNVVEGNFIGTDYTGNYAVANGQDGILIEDGASGNTIGGTTAGARNIIAGNNLNDFEIDGNNLGASSSVYDNNSTGNVVEGNYIGVTANGLYSLDAVSSGSGNGAGLYQRSDVLIDYGAQNNTIGGTAAGAGNYIAGNSMGVNIIGTETGTNTTGNVVEGNTIGLGIDGLTPLSIGDDGVLIQGGASNNTIGGTTAAARNVITGLANVGVAVQIAGEASGTQTSGNVVEGNYIGTDATGLADIDYADYYGFLTTTPTSHEDGDGILIDEAAQNTTIGGTTAGARNVIAGNLANGVEIEGTDGDFIPNTNSNTVEGNYIGVDATSGKALGNGEDGVYIDENAESNLIGGTAPGAGNVISGNGFASTDDSREYGDGIEIRGASPGGENNNAIVGNFIGTDVTGTIAIGNADNGVHAYDRVYDVQIGGSIAAAGNVIAYNGGAGVSVDPHSDISIRYNKIFSNKGLGIDVGGDGPTENNLDDGQNTPIIFTATATASSITVTGTYNGFSNASYILDFYANSSVDGAGFAQGQQLLGYIGVNTDANGNATFNTTFTAAIGNNKYITSTGTSTASAPYGNTSELSQAIEATGSTTTTPPPVAPSVSINDVSQNEGNSGTTPFTFTLTRTGDLSSASSVTVSTADGSATAGSDYTAFSNQLITFAANQATATVTVNVNGDTVVEPNETFTVNVAAFSNATVADGQGLGTIVNDDVAVVPVAPNVSINDVSMSEGNSGTTAFTFMLTRTGDLSSGSTVNVATANGSATAGSDYVKIDGQQISFAANQATATVTVNVNGDTTVEGDETFYVNVTAGSNAAISDGQGLGTILNDDVAPPLPSVSINDVSKNEGNSGTTAFTFTLSRSGDLSGASVVSVSTADGTATAGSDYAAQSGTQVSFVANQATATVTVYVNGDTAVESNETFYVNVTPVSNATISDGQGLGTIVNDDVSVTPPITIKAPSNLTGSATSSTQVSLKWKDNSNNETGFEVQYSKSSSFSNPTTVSVPGANKTSANITGLSANTTYYFRIRAVGTNSSASGYSNTASVKTKAAPAPTPMIVGYQLIDTDTKKVILTITDGMVIHRSSYPTLKHFSVQAIVSGPVESVKFSYKGSTNTQNTPPYSLFGDHGNGSYNGASFVNGSYVISATAFSQDNAKGTAGATSTIHFTVVS